MAPLTKKFNTWIVKKKKNSWNKVKKKNKARSNGAAVVISYWYEGGARKWDTQSFPLNEGLCYQIFSHSPAHAVDHKHIIASDPTTSLHTIITNTTAICFYVVVSKLKLNLCISQNEREVIYQSGIFLKIA